MTYFLTGVVLTAMLALMVPAIKGAIKMRDTTMRNWRLARTILVVEAGLIWALISLANALPEEQVRSLSVLVLVLAVIVSFPLSIYARAWVEHGEQDKETKSARTKVDTNA